MLAVTLERVKQHWKGMDLSTVDPLDRTLLDDRLKALGVEGTEEIIVVFSTLNGFTNIMDDELFAFWPIDQMIEENRKDEWVKDKRYVHFADFLIFTWTYSFKQNETPFASIYFSTPRTRS